jgi:hypothetical protein
MIPQSRLNKIREVTESLEHAVLLPRDDALEMIAEIESHRAALELAGEHPKRVSASDSHAVLIAENAKLREVLKDFKAWCELQLLPLREQLRAIYDRAEALL